MGIKIRCAVAILVYTLLTEIPFALAKEPDKCDPVHIYQYRGEIKTGVSIFEAYVSQFVYDATLAIKKCSQLEEIPAENKKEWEYAYKMVLLSMKYKNYNGKDTLEIDDWSSLPNIPEDSRELLNPFLGFYTADGQLLNIQASSNEKWIEKMQKSIALMLQLDWQKISDKTLREDWVEENTNHGKCYFHNLYNSTTFYVDDELNRKINLRKFYEPKECNDFVINAHELNYFLQPDFQTIKNEISTQVSLDYEINEHGLEKMYSQENYVWELNKRENNDYIMNLFQTTVPYLLTIRQNLTLLEIRGIDDVFKKFVTPVVNQGYTVTNDEINTRDEIKKILILFLDANIYLDEDHHLIQANPDSVHHQLLNKIQSVLNKLNVEKLEILYNEIDKVDGPHKKIRELFMQMIPYTNTTKNFLFIKKLITDEEVKNNEKVSLINSLYVAKPTKELVQEFETFFRKKDEFPVKIQKHIVLTFSRLINGMIGNSDSYRLSNEYEKYLQLFNHSFQSTDITEMKFAYVMAFANVQCQECIKYLLTIIQQKDSVWNDRFRIAAASALSMLQISSNEFDDLMKILMDKNESRQMRIAVYDILMSKVDIDIKAASKIHLIMSDDENLMNYHTSNLQGLKELDALPDAFVSHASYINKANLSMTSSRNVYKSKTNLMNKLMSKTTFDLTKMSIVSRNKLPISGKLELMNKAQKQLMKFRGIYWNTNMDQILSNDELKKNEKKFVDVWIKFYDSNLTTIVCTLDETNNDIKNPLDILSKVNDDLKAIMSNKLYFSYFFHESFFIPTSIGIPIVFEQRVPELTSFQYNVDTTKNHYNLKVDVQFSISKWIHGYSGISFYNPITKLIHSSKNLVLLDTVIPINFSFDLNYRDESLNIDIPILANEIVERDLKLGASHFGTYNVIISNLNNTIVNTTTCPDCGYRMAISNELINLVNYTTTTESNVYGLKLTRSTYNCDPLSRLFSTKQNFGTCGTLVIISPNSFKNINKLEIKLSTDYEISKQEEKSWYFIPGIKFHSQLSLGSQGKYYDVADINSLEIVADSSQGHFLNSVQVKYSQKKFGYSKYRPSSPDYFNVCFNIQKEYPKVMESHLPFEITDLKTETNIKLMYGDTEIKDFCPEDTLIEADIFSEVSENSRYQLNNNALNSECAKQKQNPLFVHPQGSSLLTWHCIDELIANTTLKQLTVVLHQKRLPLRYLLLFNALLPNFMVQLESEIPGLNIQMITPMTLNGASFLVDFSDFESEKQYLFHSVYFSQDFVTKFKRGTTSVVNFFPEIIVINNNEILPNNLTDWTMIDNFVDIDNSDYRISIARVIEGNLNLKIEYKGDELIMTSRADFTRGLESSAYPMIYLNGVSVNKFNESLFLPSIYENQKWLRLLKVDDYIAAQPTSFPTCTIYYSIKSITVVV